MFQFFLPGHESGDYFNCFWFSCLALRRHYGVPDYPHYIRILDALHIDMELVDDLTPKLFGDEGGLELSLVVGEDEFEDLHDLEIVHFWLEDGEVFEGESFNELHDRFR